MLQQVMEHIHNYFIKDSHESDYEIVDGTISLSFLLDGQRFLVIGSCLNDGVYTYHADGMRNDDDTEEVGLKDETFAGTICALAVPPAVIALSSEINTWVDKYGDQVISPYTSENVLGVYSYTKAGGNGATGTASWQDVFSSQLNRWRRLNNY